MSVTAWADEPVATAVAGHRLPGAAGRWPVKPLGDGDWQRLLRAVTRQRLSGLLATAIADGALPVTAAQRDEAAQAHRDAMTAALRLDALLLDAAAALEGASVPWRVLKGPAAAHLDYDDPALRAYGDLDLLVPGPQMPEAIRALAALGARRQRPPLRRGFDERFAKSVQLVDGDGWEIDLHRTLALEPFGLRIVADDLFATSDTFVVGGRQLPALSTEARFLHACCHASLGNFPVRLVPLRDLGGIALSGALDIDVARRLAQRWWAQAVMADAVGRAWELFELPPAHALARWAAAYRPSRAESVALSAFQRPDRRQAHRTAATLRTLPGLSRRLAYLRAMLRPDPAYLDSRGLGAASWLRRGRRALSGSRR